MYISHRPGRQRGGRQEEGGAGFLTCPALFLRIAIVRFVWWKGLKVIMQIIKSIKDDYADDNLAGSAQPRSLLNGQRLLESSLSKCSNFVSSSFGCLFVVEGLKINITTTIWFFLFFFPFQLTFQCQLFHLEFRTTRKTRRTICLWYLRWDVIQRSAIRRSSSTSKVRSYFLFKTNIWVIFFHLNKHFNSSDFI